jgi:hypothetical protein
LEDSIRGWEKFFYWAHEQGAGMLAVNVLVCLNPIGILAWPPPPRHVELRAAKGDILQQRNKSHGKAMQFTWHRNHPARCLSAFDMTGGRGPASPVPQKPHPPPGHVELRAAKGDILQQRNKSHGKAVQLTLRRNQPARCLSAFDMTGGRGPRHSPSPKTNATPHAVMSSFAQRRETSCSSETNSTEKQRISHCAATTRQDVSVPST